MFRVIGGGKPMLLAAFALGVLLRWFAEVTRPSGTSVSWKQKLASYLSALSVAILLLVSVRSRYSWLSYANHVDYLNADFLTQRDQLLPIVGFALGLFAYRYRSALKEFSLSLFIEPGSSDVIRPNTPEGQSGPQQFQPRAWLTKAGGMPIAGAAILIGLLIYFGEDLGSRLQSLKLGVVEAQFAGQPTRTDQGGSSRLENWPIARNELAPGFELKGIVGDNFFHIARSKITLLHF